MNVELQINTLIFSRLDYCNALFTCLNHAALSCLQLVQNTAARLLTKANRRSHISSIFASLYWLPVKYRIDFKTLLPYKAPHGLAHPYISELLHPYSTSRPLSSSDLGLLSIPCSLLKCKGDCAFAVRAPSLWNSLPSSVRSAESLNVFKKLLKTHLYRLAFPTIEL